MSDDGPTFRKLEQLLIRAGALPLRNDKSLPTFALFIDPTIPAAERERIHTLLLTDPT